MSKNYWIVSPNVHNDATENRWKEIISERKNAYIGFGPEDSTGVAFNKQIEIGDIIIIAQGANRNKRSYLCGIVDSNAVAGEEENTPGYAQRRKLIHTLDEQELLDLKLDYNGCAYGDADRIPALYKLKPWENPNDKRITTTITKAINQKIIDELMENIKLSPERQSQIKSLWEKFKQETKEEHINNNRYEIENLILQWNQYREKIVDDSLSLDDYTNTLGNSSATMPGGYLCNFLERTTRSVLGSSKPGTAFNFEVKLNNDNSTYHIRSSNNNRASREDAEIYFNENIKSLLKSLVTESDPLEKIKIVENANYSAKQILMKMSVLA